MAANAPAGGQGNPGQTQGQVQPPLNAALQQQLNLEGVKTRAHDLFTAITRILEHFDAAGRHNQTPKWQEVLGQFAMVNVDLLHIVEDIKKVSKAFVVYPKNVNAENSTILPVMLSSKLLPEMEAEETSKKEQILAAISNFPVAVQVEKLKSRIEAIGAACDCAEKVIADARKVYGLGSRQNPAIMPQIDKVQAAKIEEQEKLLRAAASSGEGLRVSGDQRLPTVLPPHLVPALASGDGALYQKNPLPSNVVTNAGASQQASAAQLIGRSVPSPMAVAGATSIDNASASPLQYANSPRPGTNIMNAPSPQQQQRQKLTQTPQHPQQFQPQQQQLKPQSTPGMAQNPQEQQSQLHQKFAQDRPSYLNYSNRPLPSGQALQHSIGQNQLNQGSQLKSHLGQLTGNPTTSLYSGTQTSMTTPHMVPGMTPQSNVPRQTFGLPTGQTPRNITSQMLPDTMYNMGASGASQSATNLVQLSQQGGQSNFTNLPNVQLGGQSNFANLSNPTQNPLHGTQTNFSNLPNPTQNPNYGHQRQPPPQ